MQVTETLSEGLRRTYSVVVPAADLEGKCRAKLADISRTIRLPGFRPGKVPTNLVRQRYGASVMAEVMQDELSAATDRVIEERGLRPAGQPKIDLIGEPKIEAAAAHDLAFSVELELLPEITPPDLTALTLTRLRSEPSAETVDKMLANIAGQQRTTEPVTEDRAAETGDVVKIDFLGSLNGEPFEGGAGTDADVEIGGTGFIPGFAEGIIGMKAGEVRVIDVTFPADYHAAALAGQEAQFEITAKALLKPVDAQLDDTLAAKLGFENLEKLREIVTQQIQREYDNLSRLRIKRELLDALAEYAAFPAPQNLVETEFAAIWQRVEADLREGREDEEDRGRDPEVLKAEYRAIADRRVRLGLLLSEIGRLANVQVSQAELNQALRQEASRYPGQEMQVVEFFRKTPQAIEQLRGPIFEDKVVDHILGVAAVTDELVAPEQLQMPPADAALAAPAVKDEVDAAVAAHSDTAHTETVHDAVAGEVGADQGAPEQAPA